jgi:hypothetical protein
LGITKSGNLKMTEEGRITMSEFKTVVERFEENQKKSVEVMQHEFKGAKAERSSLKEQVALLHEGQTAIRVQLIDCNYD